MVREYLSASSRCPQVLAMSLLVCSRCRSPSRWHRAAEKAAAPAEGAGGYGVSVGAPVFPGRVPFHAAAPRRQRHHEKPRPVQRLGDAAPQIRAGRPIGVIAKHPQRPQLTQAAPDTVQTLVNPRNHRPITMGIGQNAS